MILTWWDRKFDLSTKEEDDCKIRILLFTLPYCNPFPIFLVNPFFASIPLQLIKWL